MLLFGLFRGCVARQEEELIDSPPRIEAGPAAGAAAVAGPAAEAVALPNGRQARLEPGSLASDLRAYLADTAPAPRTFRFDRLNFDIGSAMIRPADESAVAAVGQVLQAYPNARLRVTGYADARGGAPANADLGRQRADAVAAALSGNGVPRDRIETASGGEGGPVATNATAPGRADNRRTELTVTAK